MGLMGIGKGMKFPKTDLGALFGRGRKVNKVLMTKPKFKITRSRNKVRNRKVLKGQDKVTFSDKFDIKKITGVKINEIKKSLKVLERFNNKMNKTINPKKKRFIQKKLFRTTDIKSDNINPNKAELEGGGSTDIALAPTNNIFLINQGGQQEQQPLIVKGGDIIISGKSGSNSYENASKYAELTALMTV